VANVIAEAELRAVDKAEEKVAVDVLTALIEVGVCVEGVIAKLLALEKLALVHIVQIAAMLGEKGHDSAGLKSLLKERVAGAGPGLKALPLENLFRLAAAAAKSPAIEEYALGPVASAAAATLGECKLDRIAEMLVAIAKCKSGAASAGAREFFGKAVETLTPAVKDLGTGRLFDILASQVKALEQCRSFFEAVAEEATSRASTFTTAQLVQLSEGILRTFKEGHSSLTKLAEVWTQRLEETRGDKAALVTADTQGAKQAADSNRRVSADDLVQLVRLFVPVAQAHKSLFEAAGARLCAEAEGLTASGKQKLLAAFPGASGPKFPGKEDLLKKLRQSKDGATPAARAGSRSRSREGRGRCALDEQRAGDDRDDNKRPRLDHVGLRELGDRRREAEDGRRGGREEPQEERRRPREDRGRSGEPDDRRPAREDGRRRGGEDRAVSREPDDCGRGRDDRHQGDHGYEEQRSRRQGDRGYDEKRHYDRRGHGTNDARRSAMRGSPSREPADRRSRDQRRRGDDERHDARHDRYDRRAACDDRRRRDGRRSRDRSGRPDRGDSRRRATRGHAVELRPADGGRQRSRDRSRDRPSGRDRSRDRRPTDLRTLE